MYGRYEYTWKKMEMVSEAGDVPNSSRSTNEENARNSTSETRELPLMSLAMLRRAIGDEISSLDINEMRRRVYAGVLLKDKEKQGEAKKEQLYTHKYWVHKELNKNCLMVLASALSITWGNDGWYWNWPERQESCYSGNIDLPIAKLEAVDWLEIKGTCKTVMLSPRTTYEVAIVVRMIRLSFGWQDPVNLALALPDGNKQGSTARLDELEQDEWTELKIGKFELTPKTVGEISFSLWEHGEHLKGGLFIKGVVFKPITEIVNQGSSV
ncbi:uncharacterized protein PHLOEM PROTEIN 2-LIKE A4-like [Rhodamnia argentea]|uniref:Uncharacterized protein PHLOEM PROTEIN 2-LIKE A4-like n=1 Tax=Rhodamnia argentea TaxID=178133 RepID=A0ABM3HSL6_9MYRT|nr:uncharacterized protein PHLOEM PROTEIN 2-LIKE A4-like [Rhodamnia argentea]